MADNFNINTSLASADQAEGLNPDNPAMTYVDFGNQIVNNSQKQALQEQQVKQAVLQNQQSTLSNKQKQQSDELGINPNTKGYISKDEALSLIKTQLIRQKLLTDDVAAELQTWYAAAPNMVEQQDVKDFISRYQPKEAKNGVPFVATDADADDKDMQDENGKRLVAGQTYYSTKDEDGDTVYARGGAVPSDKSLKMEEQDHQFWVRQFKEVISKVNPYLSSSRTQVGVALQSYIRCSRALETLSKTPVTSSDAANVMSEIAAVYKGGSPDQAQMLEAKYSTIYGWFQHSIQGIFGKPRQYVPEDIRRQLVARITDLENVSRQVIESSLQAAEAGYGEIISHNQDQWDKLTSFIDKALGDSNAAQAVENSDGTSSYAPTKTTPLSTDKEASAGPDIHALAAALGLKKKAQ